MDIASQKIPQPSSAEERKWAGWGLVSERGFSRVGESYLANFFSNDAAAADIDSERK